MSSKGAIFVYNRISSTLTELSSIGIKEKFKDCCLSDTFLDKISSYQYSHFEFDSSIDWIENDLKNYLKTSNSKIIIPLFHKSRLLGILSIGEKFMSEKKLAKLKNKGSMQDYGKEN